MCELAGHCDLDIVRLFLPPPVHCISSLLQLGKKDRNGNPRASSSANLLRAVVKRDTMEVSDTMEYLGEEARKSKEVY